MSCWPTDCAPVSATMLQRTGPRPFGVDYYLFIYYYEDEKTMMQMSFTKKNNDRPTQFQRICILLSVSFSKFSISVLCSFSLCACRSACFFFFIWFISRNLIDRIHSTPMVR